MEITSNVVVVPFPEPPVKLEPILEPPPTPVAPPIPATVPDDAFVPAIPPLPAGWAEPSGLFELPAPPACCEVREDVQVQMAEVGAMITFAFTIGILTGGIVGVVITRSLLQSTF